MKNLLAAFLFLLSISIFAQQAKPALGTDTVRPGYYLPLDSNVLSCKVNISPKIGAKMDTAITGNKLPNTCIEKITHLSTGSVVVYYEITRLEKGKMEKVPAVRYVVGRSNTKPAIKNTSIPDTITVAELSAVALDTNVVSFTLAFSKGGAYYSFAVKGNKLGVREKEAVSTLKAGTRVYFEEVVKRNGKGGEMKVPGRVYIVRE